MEMPHNSYRLMPRSNVRHKV